MILDRGFCTIYSVKNTAAAGKKPVAAPSLLYQSWYGELEFATTPYNASGLQEDVRIDARVRILQNRDISAQDVAVLSAVLPAPSDALQYDIVRAYHGMDKESGQPITDLSLRKVVQQYDIG